MSARSVCSGSRPCRYHSDRAISFPFNRPLTRTLMPLQPKRSAESTALRIARRKPTRFSSCSAIFSATSCASSSGLFTSRMSMNTSRLVRFCSSPFSFSISARLQPTHFVAWPLHFHRAHARCLQLLLQLALQVHVFDQQPAVVFGRKPARVPRLVDSDPESVRMDFLSHRVSRFLSLLLLRGLLRRGLLRWFMYGLLRRRLLYRR